MACLIAVVQPKISIGLDFQQRHADLFPIRQDRISEVVFGRGFKQLCQEAPSRTPVRPVLTDVATKNRSRISFRDQK